MSATATIATSVRPARPAPTVSPTWREVQTSLAEFSENLRGTIPVLSTSRRTLEITLEDISEVEGRLAWLRQLATENLSSLS